MKKHLLILISAIIIPLIFLSSYFLPQEEQPDYIVVGWNDLGMHCSNLDFDSIVILPPYNNLRAQVIKVGNSTQNPEVVASNLSIDYEIPGNTYSVGKTNFWDYEYDIFGVELDDNIGLTGVGLTGEMEASSDHFGVDGIPITPYTDDDLENEDPFQLALLTVYDPNNLPLATTQPVIPVSNEIGCVSSGCHSSQWDILDEHSDDEGFDPTDLPVLCANCHADVALGMPGIDGVESLSYVMHEKHKDKTDNCYKCHPGQNTQCLRGAMYNAGMECADCHGDMEEVSHSISEGRQPWLEEPSCGATACHGSNYAEEPGKLYKDSKGHGGLFCSACHGSTHAIAASTNARDNVQNIALQGHAGAIDDCTVCHGVNPTGEGPHGIMASLSDDASLIDLTVDGITIDGFSPSVLDYIYQLNNGDTQVPLVEAVTNDASATVDITPASGIPGTTDVLVTAEDASTQLYSVEFTYSDETTQIFEPFETGVPTSYYNGRVNLESGRWNLRKAKENTNGYSGKAIQLRGGHSSYIVTPKLRTAGTVKFYYKGDESNSNEFKVQKKIGSGSWQTIEVVTYDNSGWELYTTTLNETYLNVKVRVRKGAAASANLFVDDFYVSDYSPQSNSFSGQENANHQDNDSYKSIENGNSTDLKVYSYSGNIMINCIDHDCLNGSVIVFDLSGQKVYETSLGESGSLTIKGLDPFRIYIVSVNVGEKRITRKVLVK